MTRSGVPILALGATARVHYAGAVCKLARFLKRERITILQTHLFDASFVGLLAARLAQIPLAVLTRHHADAVLLTGKRLPFLIDRLCSQRLASRVIAVSNKAAEVIRRYEGGSPSRVVTVPLGFEFDELAPKAGARNRLRTELGLGQAVVLCAVGRLDPLKGYDYLLDAIAGLGASAAALRVLIVGEGPERARLEQLRDRLGLRDRVALLGYRSDVADLLAASDILVHPSLSEAFNQVIIEASAAELPIIATDVGGAREVIEDGVTGVLIPPRDSRAMREALGRMLSRPDQWKVIGAKARKIAQKYSAERMVRAYESLYTRWLVEQ